MLATAHSHPSFIHQHPANEWARNRSPSLVATILSYFVIFYLYSSFAWIVMLLYPAIKVAYFLYFLVATLPFLAAVNRSVVQVLRDHWPFALMIVLYFTFISIQYALFDMAGIPAVREAYFEKGQFVTVILVSLIAFELSPNFRNLLIALYLVVVVSCVINVVEFFDPLVFPIQLSTVPGRAAGFYFNPNVSGLFIASPVPLLCGRMGRTGRLLCYAITGIGTFLTFSRGGWALWFVAVAITELARVNWKTFRFHSGNIGMIAAGLIGAILLIVASGPILSFVAGGLRPDLDTNTMTRLELIANDTTIGRLEIARQGLIAFTTAPIFGHGVGYTWQWEFGLSVHDMFVLILAEQGIVGFIWLMVLLVIWWRYPRPYGWWLVVLFCAAAPTTHNYFDGPLPAILMTFYLVAAHRLPWAESQALPRRAFGLISSRRGD